MNFYECCDLWFKYYTISNITLYIIEIDSIVVALLTYNLKFQNKYLLYGVILFLRRQDFRLFLPPLPPFVDILFSKIGIFLTPPPPLRVYVEKVCPLSKNVYF